MGDFESHVPRYLHRIQVRDVGGEVRAELVIGAEIERIESWDHLDSDEGLPAEPAGPHNRRLIEVERGHFVYGTPWGGLPEPNQPLPLGLDEVVTQLKQDEGVRCGGALVGFSNPGFPEACAAWIAAETGGQATFVAQDF